MDRQRVLYPVLIFGGLLAACFVFAWALFSAGKSLDIDQLALVVDTINVGGKVSVPVDAAAPLVADIHSGALSLSSLQAGNITFLNGGENTDITDDQTLTVTSGQTSAGINVLSGGQINALGTRQIQLLSGDRT